MDEDPRSSIGAFVILLIVVAIVVLSIAGATISTIWWMVL
jgi:flagellar basal body-associated protein FliL